MLPFETLEELNLNSNWFGIPGLLRFKDSFRLFQKLRVLNFGNLKIGNIEDDSIRIQDMQEFKEVLQAISANLEELHIPENALKDDDFTLALIPTIANMPRLKMLNISRNGQLTKTSTVGLI